MIDKAFHSRTNGWIGFAVLIAMVFLAVASFAPHDSVEFFASAFADGLESGEVGLQANSVSEAYDALTSGAERVALVLLVVLVVGVVVLGLWSSATRRGSGSLMKLAAGPSADNLFLGVKFHLGNKETEDHLGYIRALRLRSAALVSPINLRRGDAVKLVMSSLPGFPASELVIPCTVTGVVSMGGEPESFLVQVRFSQLGEKDRLPISAYIMELSKRRGALSHS